MKDVEIFKFAKKKNGRKFRVLVVITCLTVILINVCMQMILLNRQNVSNELMNNNNLMIIQMFGCNKEKNSCFMDINKAKEIPHLVFITESFPLGILLCDSEGNETEESLTIHRIPQEFSAYVGIDHAEENTIYCPKDSTKNASQYRLDQRFDKLDVKIVNYDKNAPAILGGEDFACESTFDKLKEAAAEDERVYSTPEYLIGVDKTEHVYSVVKNLQAIYSDYDIQVFYQASGLEGLVSGSKQMVKLQVLILVFILITSIGIMTVLLITMIHSMTHELMVVYMNGMERRRMTKAFYRYIIQVVWKPMCGAYVVTLFTCILCNKLLFPLNIESIIMMICTNVVVLLFVFVFLYVVLARKMKDSTSNKNISKILRN